MISRAATLARTVGIFRRNLENSNIDEGTTWEQLKQEVTQHTHITTKRQLGECIMQILRTFN